MEKEEPKMKSIFNVYRGARLKSLQSAETILHKLIFNEKAFCARVKQSEMLLLVKEKQTWSPLKRLKGCGTASLWAGVPPSPFKAVQCYVHCYTTVFFWCGPEQLLLLKEFKNVWHWKLWLWLHTWEYENNKVESLMIIWMESLSTYKHLLGDFHSCLVTNLQVCVNKQSRFGFLFAVYRIIQFYQIWPRGLC